MTLIEVTMAMASISILAMLSLGLLHYASTVVARSDSKVELNGEALVIGETLRDDFRNFGSRYRRLQHNNLHAVHRTAEGLDGKFCLNDGGYPAWQSWVGYRIDSQMLQRIQFPLEVDTKSPPNPMKNLSTKIIARDVMNANWIDLTSNTVALNIELQKNKRTLQFDIILSAGQGGAL